MADFDEHGRKLPGTKEPMPGNCGALLHATGPDDIRSGRYCSKSQGWRTSHAGSGKCIYHGGSSPNHLRKHAREQAEIEVRELAGKLGVPEPIGDPLVELYNVTALVKQWLEVCNHKLAELDSFVITDVQGVERSRAMIEIWERAIDRARDAYEKLIKIDVTRKLMLIEEESARAVAQIMVNVLESHELNLTDDQIMRGKGLLLDNIRKAAPKLRLSWIPEFEQGDVVDAELVD